MKIAFCVDAIQPPLTGIGRYAYELSKHYLSSESGITELRFFLQNRWIERLDVLDSQATTSTRHKGLPRWLLREFQIWRLRRQAAQFLFHSPNYFLPDVAETGISTIHDLSVFKYPETHPRERIVDFEKRFESTLSRANHLITDSEATRLEVIDYFGWQADRITAIPLGVSADFHPRNRNHLQPYLNSISLQYGNYSLCVSTLEPRKRINHLLDAYHALPGDIRQRYPLVLAGSKGWLSADLLSRIEAHSKDGWLRYLGFVPESVLPLLYAGARAFLYPSIYEGFGLPVLEALASGIPTLASNRSSLPEVTGGAAWLVDPDDPIALRSGVEKALLDEEWRTRAISASLSVSARFTWSQCAQRTLDLYRTLA
ncbi:glycosyltransferase family 4 protein [Burkholderia gladioli]|uniref:glycosyltransferase family 4 protein n=1 Tax=Burkholderia gladioli TaxID=28095 RepID=UPI00163EE25B|nr:glycosyltransferase family 1 protein [Burkholderia gladioli]